MAQTALFTGLSGLNAHSRQIDVIGNNISNTSTKGFKASRVVFETQFSLTPTFGTGPRGEFGGTNPSQTGLGVSLNGTQRNHTNGNIQATGITTDLAIEGNGMFILNEGGDQYFTRAGQFDVDAENYLTSPSGGIVQGYGIDESFNIVEGPLVDMRIPIGTLSFAEPTRDITIAGQLNSDGVVATQGSQHLTGALTDLGTAGAATGGTLMTDLSTDGITADFTTGDIITFTNVEVGNKNIGSFTFEVGPVGGTTTADAIGDTLADFMQFIDDALGLDASNGGGVSVTGLGEIQIDGNLGEENDLRVDSQSFAANGANVFTMTKLQSADGESIRTTMVAYDSLGTALEIDLTITKTMVSTGQTQWTYNAYSTDARALNTFLGSGVLTYGPTGLLESVSDEIIELDRSGTGALTPLPVTLNFLDPEFSLSTGSAPSELTGSVLNGAAVGTLESFSVGSDGIITGAFTNGQKRSLGQVALATFTNFEGLIEVGSNRFSTAPNSGTPILTPPGGFGTGRILGGALELSNTDLSQEFVNLITASTGFSANSRVITTADELLQQLLLQL